MEGRVVLNVWRAFAKQNPSRFQVENFSGQHHVFRQFIDRYNTHAKSPNLTVYFPGTL